MSGKRNAGARALVGRENRTESLDVRFSPAELKRLAAEADREDRTLSGLVHWIVKRYQRGDLVPKGGAR